MENEIFTCRLAFDGFAKEIAVPVSIGCRCGECEVCGMPERNCKAIFDTGATSSMVSSKIADELRLVPTGTVNVTGVHGTEKTNQYIVNLIFQNGFTIPGISVSEAGPDGGFDLLIGMDIISRGDFFISGSGGRNFFIFRYPSEGKICF